MKREKVLKDIEENLYELIGQIDYGEMSNIDTFWKGLSDAIMKVTLRSWDRGSVGTAHSVSDILKSLKQSMPDLVNEELVKLTSTMEDSSEANSHDSINEENLKILQSNAIDFETMFTEFLDKLGEIDER